MSAALYMLFSYMLAMLSAVHDICHETPEWIHNSEQKCYVHCLWVYGKLIFFVRHDCDTMGKVCVYPHGAHDMC